MIRESNASGNRAILLRVIELAKVYRAGPIARFTAHCSALFPSAWIVLDIMYARVDCYRYRRRESIDRLDRLWIQCEPEIVSYCRAGLLMDSCSGKPRPRN